MSDKNNFNNKHKFPSLGSSIRNFRLKRNMTINMLAKLTGMTSSYISQIERNLLIPSLKSLAKIGETLNVPIISFFYFDINEKGPVTRKGMRKHIKLPNSNVEYELLSPSFNYNIEFLLIKIPSNSSKYEEIVNHQGEECIYVLEGIMKVDFDKISYTLNPGDSIHFHSTDPHRLLNAGNIDVLAIVAESPPSF
jgi:transcriptional regulator with XRE-family HTH domain